MKCTWDIPEACPPVEASQLQLTDVARRRTFLVDAANGKLVQSGRTTFAASRTEANVNGVEDGYEYVIAVCCRNAEGFGEYSQSSDSAAVADTKVQDMGGAAAMMLVLHSGPAEGEAPVLEPLQPGQGKIRVRWVLPEGAKSTMVKLRKVGDNNWHLVTGTAVTAPDSVVLADGLEEGIEYEAMVAFLLNGRWCGDSPVSKPACIGEKLLPKIPAQPQEPRLFVLDQSRIAVRWRPKTAVPQVMGCAVRFRALGSMAWSNVSPSTGQLVDEGLEEPETVPSPAKEVAVIDLQAGIRYEAQVAFRNKLGFGPWSATSDYICIGRPVPRLARCTFCNCDYDLQHASYSKNPENFWCPLCRFRHMDPFNALIEPHGFLLCDIVKRQQIVFSIDLPDLRSWRKDENDVSMRMVRIDSDTCAQVWPRKLLFEANGHEVFRVVEPEEGHVRRDVPMNISAGLRPGMNTIKIVIEDDSASSYAVALVRTYMRTAEDISADIQLCDEEEARGRVVKFLSPNWKEGNADAEAAEEEAPASGGKSGGGDDSDVDEITCVISNKLRLRCPLSFERVQIPVRGENCVHLQCFGLGAYLESNSKMRAMNNRWTCPVCNVILKPQDLRIDGFVQRVLDDTTENIEEVAILQDGSYRVIEEEEDDIKQPSASPGGADANDAEADADAPTDAKEDMPTVEAIKHSVEDDAKQKQEKRKNDLVQFETPAEKRQKRRQKRAQEAAERTALAAGSNGADPNAAADHDEGE
jgi:hypothetical protein